MLQIKQAGSSVNAANENGLNKNSDNKKHAEQKQDKTLLCEIKRLVLWQANFVRAWP